jgi:hypothetical protein
MDLAVVSYFISECGLRAKMFRHFLQVTFWSLSGPFWEKRETETDATDLRWNHPMFDFASTVDADPSNNIEQGSFDC